MSEFMIPLVIFYMVGFGVVSKHSVFDDFLEGAKEGARTVIGIFPTLIGLMTAVGVLRTSGFLEYLAFVLERPAGLLKIPADVVPVLLVRAISNSAAVGLVLDLFKKYGPDSYIGMLVSILMGCTETIFYTMSVYFMSAKISKTRWTLPGAFAATAAGVAASIMLACHV